MIGDYQTEPKWRPWFYGALALLGVSIIVLTVAITLAVSDPGSDPDSDSDEKNAATGSADDAATGTATATQGASSTATPDGGSATATESATAEPTEEPTDETGDGGFIDDSPLVACTIDAPLSQNTRVARDCVIGPLVNVEGYSLNEGAAAAYLEMKAAAAEDGIDLFLVSGYRDFDTQLQLYLQEVAIYGPDQNTSAKPGHSEHQLGTTVDLNDLSESFGETPAGIWLVNNAGRFGFQMSYPAGAEASTGYAYEPWHWRWWG